MNEDKKSDADQWPSPCFFWRLDDNHTPVPCETFEEYFAFARECGASGGFPPHVDYTVIGNGEGIEISTVFLVSPAGAGIVKDPLFFETMVFGGPLDHFQCRYATWVEAAAGHQRLCAEVRRLLALSPDELAAEMNQRAEGHYRFIREEALAIGLPEDVADKLSRDVARVSRRRRK
jgi:hypothetical protein